MVREKKRISQLLPSYTGSASLPCLFALFFLTSNRHPRLAFLCEPSSHRRPTFHALSLSFETREERDSIALVLSFTRFRERSRSLERAERMRKREKEKTREKNRGIKRESGRARDSLRRTEREIRRVGEKLFRRED